MSNADPKGRNPTNLPHLQTIYLVLHSAPNALPSTWLAFHRIIREGGTRPASRTDSTYSQYIPPHVISRICSPISRGLASSRVCMVASGCQEADSKQVCAAHGRQQHGPRPADALVLGEEQHSPCYTQERVCFHQLSHPIPAVMETRSIHHKT